MIINAEEKAEGTRANRGAFKAPISSAPTHVGVNARQRGRHASYRLMYKHDLRGKHIINREFNATFMLAKGINFRQFDGRDEKKHNCISCVIEAPFIERKTLNRCVFSRQESLSRIFPCHHN